MLDTDQISDFLFSGVTLIRRSSNLRGGIVWAHCTFGHTVHCTQYKDKVNNEQYTALRLYTLQRSLRNVNSTTYTVHCVHRTKFTGYSTQDTGYRIQYTGDFAI